MQTETTPTYTIDGARDHLFSGALVNVTNGVETKAVQLLRRVGVRVWRAIEDRPYGQQLDVREFDDQTAPAKRPAWTGPVSEYTTLTDFQAGQLLYVHFHAELKYRTDAKTRVPSAQWRAMVTALVDGYFIEPAGGAYRVTARGRAYLEAHHLSIPTLS